MKTARQFILTAVLTGTLTPGLVYAQTDSASWHATSLAGALGLTALFGLFGVLLAVAGYKLFDLCTPGQLHKEIVENKNVAAAIVGGAVVLGVCIIIAAAIIG
jgi:putative membrane protein